MCEQTGSRLRCISWLYYRVDYQRSWNLRRCYATEFVHRSEILLQERDYSIITSLGEQNGTLMEPFPRQEDDLSFNLNTDISLLRQLAHPLSQLVHLTNKITHIEHSHPTINSSIHPVTSSFSKGNMHFHSQSRESAHMAG